MGTPNAGEIVLNRAESAALAALETEDDEAHGFRRASAESGLTKQQVERLHRRAKTAIAKGFTLKGMGFTKKPQAQAPDEPGLTKTTVRGKDPDAEPAKAAKTKETGASCVRTYDDGGLYHTDIEGYGYPTPSSDNQAEGNPSNESNTMTTLASMLRKNRRKKMGL